MSVLVVAVLSSSFGLAATAVADPLPPYAGLMSFPDIQGPDGPEEFSWEVKLYEGEELRSLDDTHVAVYYTDPGERIAFTIEARAAHAADGANVATTLSVTQPNVITLTVHHRAGNPAAGGAPFDYPISQGAGWEGGFVSVVIAGPPSSEQTTVPTDRVVVPSASRCTVPDLTGRTLRAARQQLRRSLCHLGPVRGERVRGARVVRQFRKAGRELPSGTPVGIKLLGSEPRAPKRK